MQLASLFGYAKPLATIFHKAANDSRYASALRQLQKFYDDFRFGKKSLLDLNPKQEPNHLLLFLAGWGKGVEKLTSTELLRFVERFCPCGKTHNRTHLFKLRSRVKLLLEKATP